MMAPAAGSNRSERSAGQAFSGSLPYVAAMSVALLSICPTYLPVSFAGAASFPMEHTRATKNDPRGRG